MMNENVKKAYEELIEVRNVLACVEETDKKTIDGCMKRIFACMVLLRKEEPYAVFASSLQKHIFSYLDRKENKDFILEYVSSLIEMIEYRDTGEKTCLFDALVQLDKIVTSKYLSIEERKNERVRINNISIIGIGTCRDNCSTIPKEEALNSFYKVASKANVTTKYFCLSDEYCMKVAEIGFHSIGTISRTFQ